MSILIVSVLLFLAFIIHVMWWRIKIPLRPTNILLFIFLFVPIIFSIAGVGLFRLSFSLNFIDGFRLALCYISCSLVYIILYSAIEQQSPTLAIIGYLNQCGNRGCSHESLIHYLSASDEIKKRLTLMAQGGWLISGEDHWHLSDKGRFMASLFEYTAVIFGLKKGG